MDREVERHYLRAELRVHAFHLAAGGTVQVLVKVGFQVDCSTVVVFHVDFGVEPLVVTAKMDGRVQCEQRPEFAYARFDGSFVAGLACCRV